MIEFRNDDGGYLAWIARNRDGFVLNVRRKHDPAYVVLHRVRCATISDDGRASGAYTARGYRKVCALSVAELQTAAKREGRSNIHLDLAT